MGSIAAQAIRPPTSWDLAWARIYGGLLAAAGAYCFVSAIAEWYWDPAWSFRQRFLFLTEDVIFLAAALALATSGIGLLRRQVWGWYGAVCILTFACALPFADGLISLAAQGCLADFKGVCVDITLVSLVVPGGFYYLLVHRQLFELSHRSCYRADGVRMRWPIILAVVAAAVLSVLRLALDLPYMSSFPGIP